MQIIITIAIISTAALFLISGNTIANVFSFQLHQNQLINSLAKYQLLALITGTITMIIFIQLNPQSKKILSIGNLSTIAIKNTWLAIDGTSSWLKNGMQLLLSISLATAIFMFIAVKNTQSLNNFQWAFMPIVILCSFTNSFAEEMIFRFGIISGLQGHCSKITILIISAIMFGMPHYFGNPGGIIGIIMSGILGYILCKATIETQGIFIAWLIHFIQDIIIFTAIMMINFKN